MVTLPALLLAQTLAVLGLVIVARARMRRDPKIGRPIVVRHDSAGVKPALLAAQSGLAIVTLLAEDFPRLPALGALYGAFVLTWLTPGVHDRGLGEKGVFLGWRGRRFSELEGWCLTQGELRVKLLGEWNGIPLAASQRARTRALLEQAAPELERDSAEGRETPPA